MTRRGGTPRGRRALRQVPPLCPLTVMRPGDGSCEGGDDIETEVAVEALPSGCQLALQDLGVRQRSAFGAADVLGAYANDSNGHIREALETELSDPRVRAALVQGAWMSEPSQDIKACQADFVSRNNQNIAYVYCDALRNQRSSCFALVDDLLVGTDTILYNNDEGFMVFDHILDYMRTMLIYPPQQ